MLDFELDAFGKRLGLPTLGLNENGLATITMDGIGTLTLQMGEGAGENRLLMMLAVPTDPADASKRYYAALERVGWRSGLPYPLSVALFRDNLIWTVRISDTTVTAADLENILRFLMNEAAH